MDGGGESALRSSAASDMCEPSSFPELDFTAFNVSVNDLMYPEIMTPDQNWNPSYAMTNPGDPSIFPSFPQAIDLSPARAISEDSDIDVGLAHPCSLAFDPATFLSLNEFKCVSWQPLPRVGGGDRLVVSADRLQTEPTIRSPVAVPITYDQLMFMSVPNKQGPACTSHPPPRMDVNCFPSFVLQTTILNSVTQHANKAWRERSFGFDHSTSFQAPWSEIAVLTHRLYPNIALAYLRLLLQNIGGDPKHKVRIHARIQKLEERIAAGKTSKSSHIISNIDAPQLGTYSDPALEKFMVDHLALVTWLEAEAGKGTLRFLEAIQPACAILQILGRRNHAYEFGIPAQEIDSQGLRAAAAAAAAAAASDRKHKRPIESKDDGEGLHLTRFSTTQANEGEGAQGSQFWNLDPIRDRAELKKMLRRQLGENPRQKLASLVQSFQDVPSNSKLPDEARQELITWWEAHKSWPYPADEEKEALRISTKLSPRQINNWFTNQRKRHWKHPEPVSQVPEEWEIVIDELSNAGEE